MPELAQALQQIERRRSAGPVLSGQPRPDDPSASQLTIEGLPPERVVSELADCLAGMPLWQHPHSLGNVHQQPLTVGLTSALLSGLFNPNLCSEEAGPGFAAAERRTVAMTAELVGYDPTAASGVFTFGGTGALLYGLKVGLEKACPGTLRRGVQPGAVVLCSVQAHYAVLNAAGWLGLGEDQVQFVPTDSDNALKLDALDRQAREHLAAGRSIAAVVATLGTTDAFGLDDLAGMHALREAWVRDFRLDYRPHLHADAVTAWAWAVFADYDFELNPLSFPRETLSALAAIRSRVVALPLADSIGIDFHKTGFAPYASSLVLLAAGRDLQLLARARESMPYLYQSGMHHPGVFTLETSRSAAGPLAALASLLVLGRQGFRTLLAHSVAMTQALGDELRRLPAVEVLNPRNPGPVTLFRVFPTDDFANTDRGSNGVETAERRRATNLLNRRLGERLRDDAHAGRGALLSWTADHHRAIKGQPLVALKAFALSPLCTAASMREVAARIEAARSALVAETGP